MSANLAAAQYRQDLAHWTYWMKLADQLRRLIGAGRVTYIVLASQVRGDRQSPLTSSTRAWDKVHGMRNPPMPVDPEMEQQLQRLTLAAEQLGGGALSPSYQQFPDLEALGAWMTAQYRAVGAAPLLHWVQQRKGDQSRPLIWLGGGDRARAQAEALVYLLGRVPALVAMTRAMVETVASADTRVAAAEQNALMTRAALRLLTQRVAALTAQHGGPVEEYFQSVYYLATKLLGAESPDESRVMQEALTREDWQTFEESKKLTDLLRAQQRLTPPPAVNVNVNINQPSTSWPRRQVDRLLTNQSVADPKGLDPPASPTLRPYTEADMMITVEEIQEFSPRHNQIAYRALVRFDTPDHTTVRTGRVDVHHDGTITTQAVQGIISEALWAEAQTLTRKFIQKHIGGIR